jgi:hypothetical protein
MKGLVFQRCKLAYLDGYGLKVDGQLALLFCDTQVVNLAAASMQRLDCHGTHVVAQPNAKAGINLDHSTIGGTVRFIGELNDKGELRRFETNQAISIVSAEIAGGIVFDQSVVSSFGDRECVRLGLTKIGGLILASKSSAFSSGVVVEQCEIGGSIEILGTFGTTRNNPPDFSLLLDRSSVGGDAIFGFESHFDNEVSLRSVMVGGQLKWQNIQTNACWPLNLTGAIVRTLEMGKIVDGRLATHGHETSELRDEIP